MKGIQVNYYLFRLDFIWSMIYQKLGYNGMSGGLCEGPPTRRAVVPVTARRRRRRGLRLSGASVQRTC